MPLSARLFLSLSQEEGRLQYRKDKKGTELSILGYGCLRFTKKNGKIDLEKAEKEIMEAVRNGVNYFDTAYVYHGSEAALAASYGIPFTFI